MIKSKQSTVYLDPYILPENPEKADLVLVTHDHQDHCDDKKVSLIRKSETIVVAPSSAAKKLTGATVIAEGDVKEFGGIKVTAVPAYNTGLVKFHTRGNALGYVIEADGVKIYHAGDTDFIPEMKELAALNIDLALLPIGGMFTMNIENAVKAVDAIRPEYAFPMHYNTFAPIKADPILFKKLVEEKTKTKILV